MNDPRPNNPPSAAGGDSVQRLHDPLMHVMNDPVMTFTGEEEDDGPGVGPAGHADSVQAMHDVLMREHAEPRDGFEPVPFWVAVVCGGLLMWGGFYVGTNSADFKRDTFDRSDLRSTASRPADVKEPDPQTVSDYMKLGAQVYGSRCVSCHGPEGKGGKGVPPLAGSDWVAGAQAGPARQARIVLYGVQGEITVNGEKFKDNMPSWVQLRDWELASALTYVRNSWGNRADPDDGKPGITTGMITAARAKEGPKRQPYTEPELKAIPVEQADAVAPPKKDEKK
jgi:mono/diheme cytochrome c family protein